MDFVITFVMTVSHCAAASASRSTLLSPYKGKVGASTAGYLSAQPSALSSPRPGKMLLAEGMRDASLKDVLLSELAADVESGGRRDQADHALGSGSGVVPAVQSQTEEAGSGRRGEGRLATYAAAVMRGASYWKFVVRSRIQPKGEDAGLSGHFSSQRTGSFSQDSETTASAQSSVSEVGNLKDKTERERLNSLWNSPVQALLAVKPPALLQNSQDRRPGDVEKPSAARLDTILPVPGPEPAPATGAAEAKAFVVGRVVGRPLSRGGSRLRRKREVAFRDQAEAAVDHGPTKTPDVVAKETEEEYQDFEVISDADREAAHQALMQELFTYALYTLLIVAFSIFTVVCFLMDPRACLLAFSTGSPCCLLCPSYRNLMQYTDPVKLIKANVNIYVPGIYVEEGGKLREYPPTTEEMDCLQELIGEFFTPLG